MKKVSSIVALFVSTHLFGPDVDETDLPDNFPDTDETMPYVDSWEYEASPLQETRKFKIALITTYTFLISIFGGIVYISAVLDPKFPF